MVVPLSSPPTLHSEIFSATAGPGLFWRGAAFLGVGFGRANLASRALPRAKTGSAAVAMQRQQTLPARLYRAPDMTLHSHPIVLDLYAFVTQTAALFSAAGVFSRQTEATASRNNAVPGQCAAGR
jgi:hypothetical protein